MLLKGNKRKNGTDSYDWPTFSEKHWYAAAVSLVIIGMVLATLAVIWVFSARDLVETKGRMDILTPVFTIYLAIVTFCTVAWRGMVTSRQADQQKRQNDAKDEENLAKLLVDGTKLVSEENAVSAQVHAGIAALQVVSTAPLDRFAIHAMDILILVVERTYKDRAQEFVYEAARDALNAAARMGRKATRSLSLTSTAEEDVMWQAINGPRRVFYTGGNFVDDDYTNIADKSKTLFTGVYFDECSIKGAASYRKQCSFSACTFDFISRGMFLSNNFDNCNLSGTLLDLKNTGANTRHKYLEKLRQGHCFFVEGDPPSGLSDDQIATYLVSVSPEV